MQRRFTLIQGGRDEGGTGAGPRVVLRRPGEVEPGEIAAWRELAARAQQPDPFADPDLLVTAARHARPRDGTVVLALAFGDAGRPDALVGVLPLLLPHPLWGGPVRLWRPALAPRPIEPTFADGRTVEAVAGIEAGLRALRPRSELCLAALGPGAARRALGAAGRLDRGPGPASDAIPAAQFVRLAPGATPERTERASGPEAVRAAVERFLLADAREAPDPLLADPDATAVLRVATRLLARRDLVEVELGLSGDAVVSGAIRLGPPGRRETWRVLAPAIRRPGPDRMEGRPDAPPRRGGRPGPGLRLVTG